MLSALHTLSCLILTTTCCHVHGYDPCLQMRTGGLERLPGMKQWGCSRSVFLWPYKRHLCAPRGQGDAASISNMKSSPNQSQSAVLPHTSWTGCGLSVLFLCRCPGCWGIASATMHTHAESLVRFSFLWFYRRQCHWRIIKTPDGFMLGPPDMVM